MNKIRSKKAFFACLMIICIIVSANNSAKSIAREETGRRSMYYQRALYEAAEGMAGMQATLKKLTATASAAMEIEYLSEIAVQASGIQKSLSILPVGADEITKMMKFVNQAGDFADSALAKLAHGGALSNDDRETAASLCSQCAKLSLSIGEILMGEQGNEWMLENEKDMENADYSFLTGPDRVYPVLLYDGPFSDSLLSSSMKGLTNEKVTREKAMENARAFLSEGLQKIEYNSETFGEEKCFVFDAVINGLKSSVSVTERGGRVLYVICENTKAEERLSEDECIKTAMDYLQKRGFPTMHAGYYRKFAGVLTVNLAPVENGVILYPDLIKMQVNMENGDICGMEFTNYYSNHENRTIEPPLIDETQALLSIDSSLEPIGVKTALIPLSVREVLSYEVHAKRSDGEFLVYIDAYTGDEIMMYEVVEMQDGTIVQ